MQLHEWAFKLAAWRRPHGRDGGETNASSAVVEATLENVGATIMGRKMFGGGADVAQQYLAAGLIDEMLLNFVPVLLGSGTRLFENLGDVSAIGLEQVSVVEAPDVAHLTYRRSR